MVSVMTSWRVPPFSLSWPGADGYFIEDGIFYNYLNFDTAVLVRAAGLSCTDSVTCETEIQF
jgi:hypothetical protein